MKNPGLILALLIASPLLFIQTAWAGVPFDEDYEAPPCPPCVLAGADYINREISLMGGPWYSRNSLTDFLDELLLPICNGGDIELLWSNGGGGAGSSLALTQDTEDGNYPFQGVTITTDFAAVGDLDAASAQAGVVVRHTGPAEAGDRKFYSAWGHVFPIEGVLKITFFLAKWFGPGFVDLDSGPAATAPFDFSPGENFRIELEVTEPDEEGVSGLTANFYRLWVTAEDVLIVEPLAELVGTDRALHLGQVGVWAGAGSVGTEIAFDDTHVFLLGPPTSARRLSWGAIKALYR